MIYAYINSQGYVQSIQNDGEPQTIPNLTVQILDEPLPPSPNPNYSYNINTKVWEDARTDQQKYNQASTQVLAQRNSLLYASDWTQIPGNPLTTQIQQEWATYRQSLRDIPTQTGYPFNVVWPTAPTTN